MKHSTDRISNCRTINLLIRDTIYVLCVIVFFTFIIQNTYVASNSMEPTLMAGDLAIYNRMAYQFGDVERGDIITFWSEEEQCYCAKRVIGIAGDTIKFENNQIYINDFLIDESLYLSENVDIYFDHIYNVPDNCVFVMGDNRLISKDSRYFLNPYISMEDVVGKYIGSIPLSHLRDFFK